ncbi:MAG TPA: citrate/2-methylcitrate synthase, partial [Methanobacterium sp.]
RGVMGYLGPIESPEDLEEVAKVLVHELLNNNEKIPGFGHRYHEKDPRAPKLMELAQKYKCYGLHTQLAQAIQDALFDRKGINMNVDGANAGILSDLGFDWKIATGIFMVGRLPAMISHVYEEMTVESSFRKFFELEEIYYDGMKEINP